MVDKTLTQPHPHFSMLQWATAQRATEFYQADKRNTQPYFEHYHHVDCGSFSRHRDASDERTKQPTVELTLCSSQSRKGVVMGIAFTSLRSQRQGWVPKGISFLVVDSSCVPAALATLNSCSTTASLFVLDILHTNTSLLTRLTAFRFHSRVSTAIVD